MEGKKEIPELKTTILKRTELPVYSEVTSVAHKSDEKVGNELIFQAVQRFRIEGCKVAQSIQLITDRVSRFYDTGVSHAYSNYVTTVEYLHEERNILSRIGAVSGGLMVGYIIGLRKGFFKRLFYTATGGIAVGAVCYPKEAEEYYKQSSQLSKKYFVIGYHLLNGVTKDLGGFELPTFPLKMLTQDVQEQSKKD